MEGLFFLLRKFCFHVLKILHNCWMVIVVVARCQSMGLAIESSQEWNALRTDPKASLEVSRRKIRWRRPNADVLKGLERRLPVAVTVSIFPAEPANKISIIEMETQ